MQIPEDINAAAVNIHIDLCGGTEVPYRDWMDGTHDTERHCCQLQLLLGLEWYRRVMEFAEL